IAAARPGPRPRNAAQASPMNQPLSSIMPESRRAREAPTRTPVQRANTHVTRAAKACIGAANATVAAPTRPVQGLPAKKVWPIATRYRCANAQAPLKALGMGRDLLPLTGDQNVRSPRQRFGKFGANGDMRAIAAPDRRLEPNAFHRIIYPRLSGPRP